MPTPLSCKSASALDSLPRNANARRSGTALNRLQQQRVGSKTGINDSGEIGIWDESVSSLTPASPILQTKNNLPSRKLSDKFAPRRKRKISQKSNKAIASNDLPLASSDLYNDNQRSNYRSSFDNPSFPSRDAFSDGEQEGLGGISEDDDDYDGVARHSIRVVGGGGGDQGLPRVRAISLSPKKLYQPIMMPIEEPEYSTPDKDESQISEAMSPISNSQKAVGNAPASPSKRRQQSTPARKRIITKEMIGKPTNFQHTGHIGATSYGGAVSMDGGDAERLRQQLSEVAAALRLDDGNVSSNTSCLPSREASKDSRAGSSGGETALTEDLSPMPMHSVSGDYSLQDQSAISAPQLDTSTKQQIAPDLARADSQHSTQEITNKTALKRTTSKRKPVPTPRNLADLYGEFSQPDNNGGSDKEFAILPDHNQPTTLPTSIEEETENGEGIVEQENQVNTKPVPTTIRANGKRMVEGPAGDYITETANVRWNKAMNEITLALKDENNDDDGEEEDIQTGLQRADEVLRQLNAT
ncbi:uncharacterized protein FA14DRAFT_162376 [Meira miltonrushii]|uniref:CRIB domain-containing protein n=1 Tax=Meira miltonrushii TaxID=1280837 RepID=A0A316V3I8_9BASI|nr:uncharacterized protein FA14DRAFT_162376 [Meira miltonrushii]PWN32127.1 hypothetical protein FA14DRAFT_162376 [Meira miltonrushii]